MKKEKRKQLLNTTKKEIDLLDDIDNITKNLNKITELINIEKSKKSKEESTLKLLTKDYELLEIRLKSLREVYLMIKKYKIIDYSSYKECKLDDDLFEKDTSKIFS